MTYEFIKLIRYLHVYYINMSSLVIKKENWNNYQKIHKDKGWDMKTFYNNYINYKWDVDINKLPEVPPVRERKKGEYYNKNGEIAWCNSGHVLTKNQWLKDTKKKRELKAKKRELKAKKHSEWLQSKDGTEHTLKRIVFNRLKEWVRIKLYLKKYKNDANLRREKREYDREYKKNNKAKLKKNAKKYYNNVLKFRNLCINCDETKATKKHYKGYCRDCFSQLFPEENEKLQIILNKNKKTELKLFEYLKDIDKDCVYQSSYEWCKNKDTDNRNIYDYEIFKKILIELDGPQHIKYVPHFHRNGETDLSIQIERDEYKMNCALKNGFHIIRILQEDVWFDKNNWREELKTCIDILKNINHSTIICIGNNKIYNQYN